MSGRGAGVGADAYRRTAGRANGRKPTWLTGTRGVGGEVGKGTGRTTAGYIPRTTSGDASCDRPQNSAARLPQQFRYRVVPATPRAMYVGPPGSSSSHPRIPPVHTFDPRASHPLFVPHHKRSLISTTFISTDGARPCRSSLYAISTICVFYSE